jgi:uracil-DNA glycosylase family 4
MQDSACTRCKLSQTCKKVCDLDLSQKRSEVMVIGETPNTRCRTDRMRATFEKLGLKPYYASAVNCEPDKGKKPTDAQIRSCRHFVKAQIEKVKPKFVLLSGNAALYSIKDCKGIMKERGRPFEQDGIIYVPTVSQLYTYFDPESQLTFDRDVKLLADIVDNGEIPRARSLNYVIVKTRTQLERMFEEWVEDGELSFDIETTGLFPWMKNSRVTLIGFSNLRKQWMIPCNHRESPWFDVRKVVRMIDRVLRRKGIGLITHNGKFDYLWMKVHFGVNWNRLASFDTMIAHYMLDENSRHGLKELAMKYCGAPDWDVDKTIKIDGPLAPMSFYAAHDVYYTRQLKKFLSRKFREEPSVYRVFRHIMMPCVRMFVDIEYDGVYIDRSQMADAEEILRKKIKDAKKQLDTIVKPYTRGQEVLWSSPKQIASLLFEKMRIKVVEVTKSGAPSSSESVLLRIKHPVAKALLEYRGAQQQLSFFIEGWKPYITKGGWLHPSFKLHGTVTGRLSCENPNLQQVPRDGFIRNLIKAPAGWEFIEADLSQIELRIAAELAGARSLIDVFTSGGDAHWLTALTEIERGKGKRDLVLATGAALAKRTVDYGKAIRLMLKAGADACIEIDDRWKELRKKAKAVNFGYLYGMGWRKFQIYARDNYGVDVTEEQAMESRAAFFYLYPELEAWHRKQRRIARSQGYVSSLSGRRRRLPAATLSDDVPPRREAERQAINSPVQSFANELNLMVALQVTKEFDRNTVKICGTVHDAIIFMVRTEHVPQVYKRVVEIMKRPKLMDVFGIKMSVPIEGEAKIGPWGKGVRLEKWLSQQGSPVRTSSSAVTTSKASATSKRAQSTISSLRAGSSAKKKSPSSWSAAA